MDEATRTMNIEECPIPNGLDRLDALLAWWGMPREIESGDVEAQPKRTQTLAIEPNKAVTAACRSLPSASERLARSLQYVFPSRKSRALVAVQPSNATSLVQSRR